MFYLVSRAPLWNALIRRKRNARQPFEGIKTKVPKDASYGQLGKGEEHERTTG
jgi:hypothetical protein